MPHVVDLAADAGRLCLHDPVCRGVVRRGERAGYDPEARDIVQGAPLELWIG